MIECRALTSRACETNGGLIFFFEKYKVCTLSFCKKPG